MKKILALLITAMLVFVMSISVFADPGAFVQSPSANGAPVLDEENSDGNIKVTAYRDREKELNSTQIKDFEAAYKSVVSVSDLTTINSAIADVAANVQVSNDDLAVSDLFYISLVDESKAVAGATYKLNIQSDTFKNFVCLIKRVDGKWYVVENVELKDETVLEFSTDDLGSYAVVVSTGDIPVYPEPAQSCGEFSLLELLILLAIIFAAVVIVNIYIYIRKLKKASNE